MIVDVKIRTMLSRSMKLIFYFCFTVALIGCGRRSTVDLFSSSSPRERYENSLRKATLDQTALGQAWLRAGQQSLQDSLMISLPFREVGYFAAERPEAVSFRYPVRVGQVVHVSLQPSSDASVFIDVLAITDDTTFQPVTSADSTHHLTYEVEYDEVHVLRVQPELLQDLTYELTIEIKPLLSFPVAGKDSEAISSFFGAPRDGGQRRHKGVDIFAPKGTPVLAASDGVVGARMSSGRGGKVVWLATERANQYYAHLDSQTVRPAQRVQTGDTLGFVGNTGNARYTPPHLHFGVYHFGRGALDPYPFLHRLEAETPLVQTDTSLLKRLARVRVVKANVRASPTVQSEVVGRYDRHTLLRLQGTSGTWFRAELPNGQQGYVHQSLIRSIHEPIGQVTVDETDQLYTSTQDPAFLSDELPGKVVPVLASFDSLLWVETQPGLQTWLQPSKQPNWIKSKGIEAI